MITQIQILQDFVKNPPNPEYIQNLFQKLSHILQDDAIYAELFRASEVQSGNILMNLALLANSEIRLPMCVIEKFITEFLNRYPNADVFSIEKLFIGLRQLIDKNALPGQFSGKLLQRMIARFSECQHFSSRNFFLCMLTLNDCIDKNKLNGFLDGAFIDQVINHSLSLKKINLNELAKSFFGLGKIVSKGFLHGQISAETIQRLLIAIGNDSFTASKEIGNCFYGLRLLARNNAMNGEIRADVINTLMFSLLRNGTDSTIPIFNTLFSVSQCSSRGFIKGRISSDLFIQLLLDGLSTNLQKQTLNDIPIHLGQLFRSNQFDYPIHAYLINRLMHIMVEKKYPHDVIIKFFNALNYALNKDFIEVGIDPHPINILLNRLLVSNLADIRFLTILPTIHMISRLINTQLITNLQEFHFENYLALIKKNQLDFYPISHLLSFVKTFACAPQNTQNTSRFIYEIFTIIGQKNFLSPENAIISLDFLVQHRHHYQLENEIALQIIANIPLPFVALSPSLKDRVKTMLFMLGEENLAQELKWQLGMDKKSLAAVEEPCSMSPSNSKVDELPEHMFQPINDIGIRPPPIITKLPAKKPFSAKMSEKIWDLIAKKDFDGLLKLLDIKTVSPRGTPSPKHEGFFRPSPRNIKDNLKLEMRHAQQTLAETMVRAFFEKTNGNDLKRLISKRNYRYFELLLRACSCHVRYQLAIDKVLHPLCLYIPFKDIEVMVNSLRDFGIYRDHNALLNIVDALLIRQLSLEDEAQINLCKDLRKQLLERGIAFHDKTNHRHVCKTLGDKLVDIQVSQFIYDEIEELDTVNIPEESEAVSLSQHPLYRLVAQEAHLFSDSRLAGDKGEVNLEHLYTSEDINHILELRLPEHIRAYAMGAIMYHNGEFDQLLRDSLLNRIDSPCLLFPILISQHWVGIRVQRDLIKGYVVTFYDSIISLEREKMMMERILPILKSILGPRVEWRAMHQSQIQDDVTSCGAYLIENIARDFEVPLIAPQQSKIQIRQFHLELLRQHMPAYYQMQLTATSGDKRASDNHDRENPSKRFK